MRKTAFFLAILTFSLPSLAEPTSYVRFDQDYLFGSQIWAGGTIPFNDRFALALTAFIPENYPSYATGTNSWWGELDAGPAVTLGPLTLTPMAVVAFDWASKKPVALNAPQLYIVVNTPHLYLEQWLWTVLYSPFHAPVYSDYIHTRNWILYRPIETFAFGPQFELTYNLNTQGSGTKGMTAVPLGGHVEVAFNANNTLGLFLGYELSRSVRRTYGGNALEGRLSFNHTF